ncbi:MarR family winged helix-turn-helix transcriptional regulator [Bordetella sp. FB-8]|uniref:MarR family winged helix-turn-helix transcriptional regulator n=1 Tax=Bordetella sp. FB-8 TaxID=1159870 RepID=UPI000367B959|nr:helix-turn-helix domain-containing protein [Bordetella sp. FB-8]
MFEHCIYFNATSLARQLEREWARAFKPFGLTPPQAFMLRAILDKGSITSTDLAAELNITKATCSRTLDGLIELGCATRVQAGADGRSHALHPTAKSRGMQGDLNQASAETTRKIKRIIGSDTFEATVKSLRRIRSSIR